MTVLPKLQGCELVVTCSYLGLSPGWACWQHWFTTSFFSQTQIYRNICHELLIFACVFVEDKYVRNRGITISFNSKPTWAIPEVKRSSVRFLTTYGTSIPCRLQGFLQQQVKRSSVWFLMQNCHILRITVTNLVGLHGFLWTSYAFKIVINIRLTHKRLIF